MKYIVPSDALVKTGYYEANFPGIELFIQSVPQHNCQSAAEFWLNQLACNEKRLVVYLPVEERYYIYKLHEIEFICVKDRLIYLQTTKGFFKLPWTVHNAVQYTAITMATSLVKIRFTFYVTNELFLQLTSNSKGNISGKNVKRI